MLSKATLSPSPIAFGFGIVIGSSFERGRWPKAVGPTAGGSWPHRRWRLAPPQVARTSALPPSTNHKCPVREHSPNPAALPCSLIPIPCFRQVAEGGWPHRRWLEPQLSHPQPTTNAPCPILPRFVRKGGIPQFPIGHPRPTANTPCPILARLLSQGWETTAASSPRRRQPASPENLRTAHPPTRRPSLFPVP